jgi:hypothetical protein
MKNEEWVLYRVYTLLYDAGKSEMGVEGSLIVHCK